jgi:hypothetical protein
VVAGLQPAVVGIPEFCKRSDVDHSLCPLVNTLMMSGAEVPGGFREWAMIRR